MNDHEIRKLKEIVAHEHDKIMPPIIRFLKDNYPDTYNLSKDILFPLV